MLDLSFDVDHAVCFGFGLFENLPGLAGQKSDGTVLLFEKTCWSMIQDEVRSLLI